jgi:hypothetical protein
VVKPIVSINGGRIKADLAKVGQRMSMARQIALNAARDAMVLHANDMVANAQRRLEPQTRSGELSASGSVTDPEMTQHAVEVWIGFNKEYAAQREKGGPIRAVRAKMLAIPLDPALTAAGVPKYSSPREIPGAFVLKLWGRAFIAAEAGTGKNRILTLFYVLKESVVQTGSHYMEITLVEKGPEMAGVVSEAVGRAWGGAK